ncbi:hypothetical protein PRIC1_008357 [Phytophthora ramorum]
MADAASAAESVIDDAATEDLTPSSTILDGMRVYFVIGAIGWLAFELGRVKLQRAYYCREGKAETTNRIVTRCHDSKVFGWLKLLFVTSDDELMDQCGMDTLFFFRFLRLCEKVTAVGVLCSAATFPIYYYAKRDTLDALYRMTLSHLDTDEMWRFWFTVVTMYLVSLTTCYLLWQEYQEYIRRRHEFMSRKHSQQYTVVLNGLPPNLCTQQTLRNYLELLFPKSVLHVYVALECRDLEKLVAERVKIILASVLATKQVALPATFAIILPFITVAFHLFVSTRYPKIALNLPLDQAVIVDSRRSRQMEDLERVLENVYMQPAVLERGPLEPDYQGLTSDPNSENQLASPPPVEKDSFRSQDKQAFSPV